MRVLAPRGAAAAAIAASDLRPATAIISDTPDARLVVFRLAPGQVVPPHRNGSTVMLTVLGGHGILAGEHDGTTDERECVAGDMVLFAPNELHSMRAADAELLLLATITPRPGDRNAA
jgi:quercetin dioxygenase-like cupin family protein